MLKSVNFNKFTAFNKLEIQFSPGMNVFIGENGTGKTHVLKAAYSACDVAKTNGNFAEKINNVFYPSNKQIGRLVKRANVSTAGTLELKREIDGKKEISLKLSITNHTKTPESAGVSGAKHWNTHPIESVYIPVKDMMANAPGFRSLYDERELHFEEIYSDVIRKAFLPLKKGPAGKERGELLNVLQNAMDGTVVRKEEEFFLKSQHGELEFTLLAEGLRKLGLLWVLIQNGTLLNGSVLFWDEPETNLNPKLIRPLIDILLRLQIMGVQIFIATHDYVVLKEIDLQTKEQNKVAFHSLYRKNGGEIEVSSTNKHLEISPNAIDDTFGSFIDREIDREMGISKK